jgi:hypothetical protein
LIGSLHVGHHLLVLGHHRLTLGRHSGRRLHLRGRRVLVRRERLRCEPGGRRDHDRRTTAIIAVTILFTLMVDSFRVDNLTI